MRKFKQDTCERLDEILCDICGESCKKEHDHEYASLSATWGYDSNKDLLSHQIELCENCFDKTISFLKDIRTVSSDNNPLDGREYVIQ